MILDNFYHNLSQSAPGSEGFGCTQLFQQCAINRALVIDPTISPFYSMHDLKYILCRHTVHPRGEPAQRLPQSQLWIFDKLLDMQYNRHFHGLYTWLQL